MRESRICSADLVQMRGSGILVPCFDPSADVGFEGLFHGLQTALVAQQMSTQVQLAQMRRALPPGSLPPGIVPGGPAGPGVPQQPDERTAPGQYL